MAFGNSVSTSAARAQVWQRELYQDVMDNLYFVVNGMMGKDDNNIVQIKDDLAKEPGQTVNFSFTAKLGKGGGVIGDAELEGLEEQLQPFTDSVSIDMWRDAVRLTGRLDEQKNSYDMRADARNKLSIRVQEFIELEVFWKMGGVLNTNITDNSGTTIITGSNLLTWSNTPKKVVAADESAGKGARYLSAAYDPVAQTGNNTNFTKNAFPLNTDFLKRLKVKAITASPKLVPLKIKGKNYYVVFIHPWQALDLKNDQDFKMALREAEVRGQENPLFTGALGIWDGLILHEHEYVPWLQKSSAANGGATGNFGNDGAGITYGSDVARGFLCGSQAIAFAKCSYDNGWVEKSFDYGNKWSIASGLMGGIQKVSFNSKDYGVIAFDTTVTPLL